MTNDRTHLVFHVVQVHVLVARKEKIFPATATKAREVGK